jgi:HPt (histidine-containing phosphotransfer) domain-containing protein
LLNLEWLSADAEGKESLVKNPSQYEEKLSRELILERLEGSQELLEELIQLFLEEAPQLVAAMREALEKGDMPGLRQSAHSMKGAASNFAAYATANAASQLEDDAKNSNAESAKASLSALEAVTERLLPQLAVLCRGAVK